MTRKFKSIILALSAVLICVPVTDVYAAKKKKSKAKKEYIYPGPEGWNEVDPEKYGFDKEKIKEVRRIFTEETRVTGVVAICGGEMIFKYGDIEELSYLASCRKSVLSMLYGKYVDNGTIDLDKTIGELGIDDVQGLTEQEKKATVRHLIQSRSGIYHPASNPGSASGMPDRGTIPPGGKFHYNNWDFNAAGTAFELMTGKNIYDAVGEDIAIPIEMQDWDRKKQKKGGNPKYSHHRAYHFNFSTRDMARIGYLMLREGKWKDQQIIPKWWVKESTSPHSPYSELSNNGKKKNAKYSYGYMWWLFDDQSPVNDWQYFGGYTALGAFGQWIMVLPAVDMVIAVKTNSVYGRHGGGRGVEKAIDVLVHAKSKKKIKKK